jgi:glutaredoxin 3
MKAVVWSKNSCPFCDSAKELLTLKGYEIEERIVGDPYTIEDLIAAVPDARSVPQIFIEEQYIGGFDRLKEHFGM